VSTTTCSGALTDQRPEPRTAGGHPRGPQRRRARPARLLGQPQLGPVPRRCRHADARRRGHARGVLPDLRLLVVLVCRSTARTSRPRRRRSPTLRCSTDSGPTSTTPASSSRSSTPRSPPGRATRRGPQRRAPGVRHPLDPGRHERAQRPVGSRVPRPAPVRRHRRGRAGAQEVARKHPSRWCSARVRAADSAVARARRQRPPRGARQGRRELRGDRAHRVRLRPHGGHLRPRHRGLATAERLSFPVSRAATPGIDPRGSSACPRAARGARRHRARRGGAAGRRRRA
jgi:hypothetical protein